MGPISLKKQRGSVTSFVVIAVLVTLILVASAIFFFNGRNQKSPETTPASPPKDQAAAAPKATPKAPEKNIYEGEDFSIEVPEGWSTKGQLPGTLVTLTKVNETHEQDPNAQKINFKSYVAVSFDTVQGRSKAEIQEVIDKAIKGAVPSAKLINTEKISTHDGLEGSLSTYKIYQQEVNFKVLNAIFVAGDKYYTISANTTANKFPEYEDLLLNTIKSFKLKS
jgi:hypothetical protein